jgi:hypothetical protein
MYMYVTYCLYMLQAGAYNVFLEDTAPADEDEFSNATTEDEDVPEDEDEGRKLNQNLQSQDLRFLKWKELVWRETRLYYMVQHLMLLMTKIY